MYVNTKYTYMYLKIFLSTKSIILNAHAGHMTPALKTLSLTLKYSPVHFFDRAVSWISSP